MTNGSRLSDSDATFRELQFLKSFPEWKRTEEQERRLAKLWREVYGA